MTAATVVAVVAALLALLAVAAAVVVLRKVQAHERLLEREIERGKGEFDAIVAREVELRSEELERTLSRARADAMSQLAEEDRRIAEERRRDVAERERDASGRLGEQLVAAQAGIEQRLADWSSDVEKLQERLAEELKRVEARQRQLMTEIEGTIGKDADRVQGSLDEQRGSRGVLLAESGATRLAALSKPSGPVAILAGPEGGLGSSREARDRAP